MHPLIKIIPFLLLLLPSCVNPSGKSREEAPALLSNIQNQASCVSFTTDETGLPVVSWCETNQDNIKTFYLAYFDGEHQTFLDPYPVPLEQQANLHEEGMPKIAVKMDGTLVAVYETSAPTKENNFAGNIKYLSSSNKGKSWSSPQYLHADTTPGKSHSFASIGRLSDGEIGACWLDVALGNGKGGRPVKFAKTIGNKGFANEIIVDTAACQCCRTAISSDDLGNISILFRDILSDSIRDMSVATSVNNGNSFNSAVPFTNDGWVVNGCPHNGPSVVNEGGNTYATWFTGGSRNGIYYAALNKEHKITDRKKITSNGRNIQLCMLPGEKKLIAFNENVKVADSIFTKIAVNKIEGNKMWTKNITSDKAHAGYPVLHAAGVNAIAVAWTDQQKVYYSVLSENSIVTEAVTADEKQEVVFKETGLHKITLQMDPVCGMSITAHSDQTVNYKGKAHGFCGLKCKEAFQQNPAAYVAKQ